MLVFGKNAFKSHYKSTNRVLPIGCTCTALSVINEIELKSFVTQIRRFVIDKLFIRITFFNIQIHSIMRCRVTDFFPRNDYFYIRSTACYNLLFCSLLLMMTLFIFPGE